MARIVPYPHLALRYESRPVERIDETFRTTIRAMFDLMYESRGIGLAANQVALPFRVFILNVTADANQKDQEQVFVNPRSSNGTPSIEDEEGCLSLPGLYSKVRRARKIRVQAFDLQGNPFELDADDLLSRAIQHEADHLSGRLFIDYLGPMAKISAAAKLREFESKFREARAAGEYPDDTEIRRRLDTMIEPSLDLAQPELSASTTANAEPA